MTRLRRRRGKRNLVCGDTYSPLLTNESDGRLCVGNCVSADVYFEEHAVCSTENYFGDKTIHSNMFLYISMNQASIL